MCTFVAVLGACSTLTNPDCAVGITKTNASPILGASGTGEFLSATLGESTDERSACLEVLKVGAELRAKGKL